MRAAAWAIAISVAVHGGAAAYVATREPLKPLPWPQLAPAPPPGAQEPQPTEVVLLTYNTAVAALPRDTGAVSHASRAPARTHIGTSPASGGPSPEARGPAAPAEGAGRSALSMRQPGEGNGVDFHGGVPGGFIDDFLANSKPLEKPVPTTGELHPNGRETKSKHLTFTAHIEQDGTAHFDTPPDVELKPGCLFVGCRMAFDDALMRKHHIDPYASAKRQWLEKTFDERAAMGIAFHKDQLGKSAVFMQQNLDWMWRKTTDAVERKQALFELWDEVAESGDDDLVKGGEAARAYLIGFVRTRLPSGSPGAFTAEDLAALNAHRKSHAVFAPYE